jgi:hypothetical protein
MNLKPIRLAAGIMVTTLLFEGYRSSAQPYPLTPFYTYTPPVPMSPTNFPGINAINLANVPPATNVADAQQRFNARAAAAIYQASQDKSYLNTNDDNGTSWQAMLLALWAYPEYLDDDPSGANRSLTYQAITNHQAGEEGTDTGTDPGNEYDFTLNFYIPLLYRYYSVMPQDVSDYMINNLIGDAVRSGIPTGRSGVGPSGDLWSENIHIADVIDLPETENHLMGIEAARYLANQLLYQQTQDPAYDNMRNGGDNEGPNTTDLMLSFLQGFLKNDFLEYNARPYQDYDMSALLNLETYAYDDRIRLGARMVLDYISAKEAVSSCDLRRAPPFRRRNEEQHYGPTIDGNFLGSPLTLTEGAYEAEPQICYYSMLAGNTEIFFPNGGLPGNYVWEMVHAGVTDYRIPAPILDLFVNGADRRFYQYFHHYAYNNEYANELYAGSPSYLISGGGTATTYAYRANLEVLAQVAIDDIAAILAGVAGDIIANLVENEVTGVSSDLGAAMPTFFMPTGQATSLSDMIQFGQYTTDESQAHMGVAPDFACGDIVYLPPDIQNDPSVVISTPYLFVNRGGAPGQPGYYLAICLEDNGNGDDGGFLEAYDTLLNPGTTFEQFWQAVLAANPSVNLQFGSDQVNTYTTQSGQSIQFTLSPDAQILSTTALNPAPAENDAFVAGSVMNSQQGSGLIVISNPATGQTITLDMTDEHNPRRTSETGEVDYGGEEVWVNFNFGDNSGDFAQPYRTLGNAVAALNQPNPATVFKIVSGVEHEAITISQPVQLTAVGGPVTIYGQ